MLILLIRAGIGAGLLFKSGREIVYHVREQSSRTM